MRSKRTTTREIGLQAGCSTASVSRFLRKLDLWRWIDLATMVGRRGGVWVFTNRHKAKDRDMWLAGARHTWASRKRARDRIVARIRREMVEKSQARLAAHLASIFKPEQMALPLAMSNTGATFRSRKG